LNKKVTVAAIVAVIIVCAVVAVAAYALLGVNQTPNTTPTGELDFTVSGSSNCLRFLNDSVPMVYVPFTVAANEQMQLTINVTKMPGGANGWTDIYVYKGYWNNGANNTCVSGDVYPILSDIEPTNSVAMLNKPYTVTFGDSTQQSYTVFFVFPPGGQTSFDITLKSS
jgi:hypothetical protein